MDPIWYSMCEADRTEYGGDEWSSFDIDRLMDTRSQVLERWERESGGVKVERALFEVLNAGRVTPAASSTRMIVWLARKQNGDATLNTPDGRPETWDAFNPRSLRVQFADQPPQAPPTEGEGEGAGDPPAESGEPAGAPSTS